jgi:hypothetical protein
MKLSQKDREVMEWSGKSFRKMWFSICDALQKIEQNSSIRKNERMVDLFFLPVKIDAKLIHTAMKAGMLKLVFGKNPNLFTIVLNRKGDRIIWSCLEHAKNGAYSEYVILNDRLNQEWAKKTAGLLFEDRLSEAHACLTEWAATQDDIRHIVPGVIKIAHLQFFEKIMIAWKESDDGRNIPLFFANGMEAVREIMENRWLRFYPEVNLERFLKIITPLLRAGSPVRKNCIKVFSKLHF